MENFLRFKGIISTVGILLTIFLAVKSWESFQELRLPRFDRPSISITGEGKVFAKPDIAQIQLATSVDRTSVAEAQERATELINRVIGVLRERGVEEKDIKTTSYSINPRYDYSDGRQILRGYNVTQNLEIKVRDLTKVGEILAAAAGAGANQIGGLSFTTEDPQKLQTEARDKAIEDAKRKADELASKVGVRLGKVVGFFESGGFPGPIPYFSEAVGKGGDGGVTSPVIPTGENEIRVNVTITYQLK